MLPAANIDHCRDMCSAGQETSGSIAKPLCSHSWRYTGALILELALGHPLTLLHPGTSLIQKLSWLVVLWQSQMYLPLLLLQSLVPWRHDCTLPHGLAPAAMLTLCARLHTEWKPLPKMDLRN